MIDPTDARILRALQQDGRRTNADLAEQIGLSASPCLRRVRRLEDDQIIRGYQAVVDPAKVGLPISVFVSVKLEKQRETAMQRFEAAVRRCPEVMDCYLMTGSRDYLLRVVARDLPDFERFLKATLTRIDGVASIESSFALAEVKQTTVLPISLG